ncbi:MAG: hypothetical protein ACR2QA_10725 [Solirubrobacteraceae bacterium]
MSKMLLRHGRVYPKPSTWGQEHRRWLSRQQFPEAMSALTYADLVACVDGLTARKKALAERISRLATEEPWWPTVARLRAFRGIDTLIAFAIHLELGADWTRFEQAHRLATPIPGPTSRPPETTAAPATATQLTAKLPRSRLTNATPYQRTFLFHYYRKAGSGTLSSKAATYARQLNLAAARETSRC